MSTQSLSGVRPDRPLLLVVAGAVGLIAIGLVVAFVGNRPTPTAAVDPAAPVGVVTGYVSAVRASDADTAYGLLSRAAQSAVPLDKYRASFSTARVDNNQQTRLLINPLKQSGERAEVAVTIITYTTRNDPFSSGSYSQELIVPLVLEDGRWRISQPLEPYQFR
jgi:hypothetical protein